MFLPRWVDERDVYGDISFTNGLSPSYLAATVRKPVAAATMRKNHKLRKYKDIRVRPIVVETLGRLDDEAVIFIKEYAEKLARARCVPVWSAQKDLATKLSITCKETMLAC